MTISDNAKTAYQFFLSKGLSAAQAAGIVGNLEQESGVNPESVQPNGPGRGIAQWSQGGRWNPSLMTGNNAQDLNNQLNFIWQELQSNSSYGLGALQKQTTPTGAAQVFGTDYERYGVAGARTQDAQDVYNAALSGNWGSSPINATPASFSITSPSSWVPALIKIGLIIFGFFIVLIGLHALTVSSQPTPVASVTQGTQNLKTNVKKIKK